MNTELGIGVLMSPIGVLVVLTVFALCKMVRSWVKQQHAYIKLINSLNDPERYEG